MTLVDSHCHLDDAKFDDDRDRVIERAAAAGVEKMLAIGTGDGPPDLEVALRLSTKYPMLAASVGVHPHNASQADASVLQRLDVLARESRVAALGEIGLDYHYDFSPRERQRDVFVEQLRIAAAARRPVVIHTREAWEDTMSALREHWAATALPCVMHCFTGNAGQAREALALGCYISFAGIVTYPKALDVHEAAKIVPLDRLLVETDAPYLAPAPHRGKRNEPAFVVHTAQRLAQLQGIAVEELASATTANFRRILDRVKEPRA